MRINLRKISVWFCLLTLLGTLTGCLTPLTLQPPYKALEGWKRADLLTLDAADAATAQTDLVALYTRTNNYDLQIRVDLLDLALDAPFDLYLALDTRPGGSRTLPIQAESALAWEVLLQFKQDQLTALDEQLQPISNLIPRLVQDDLLDALVISFNPAYLPGSPTQMSLQVFITPPGSPLPADSTRPVQVGAPPPATAPLLLVFWDSLPAATPAQTLRRWSGAHTGPFGQRHGLQPLLSAATENGIPLVLAGLKNPASLAGLDLVGGTDTLQDLEQRRAVWLPNSFDGDPLAAYELLQHGRQAATYFGFNTGTSAFGPRTPDELHGLNTTFAVLPDSHHIVEWGSTRLLPLPASVYPARTDNPSPEPVGPQGLTLEFKQSLLAVALSPDPSDLVTAGGALPTSPWADESIARPVFQYIATHPWIEVLDERTAGFLAAQKASEWPLPGCSDVLCSPANGSTLPTNSRGETLTGTLPWPARLERIRTELRQLPPGDISTAAWQAYGRLSAPTIFPEKQQMQANLIGQVGYLAAAARWSAAPAEISNCTADLDWDGQAECVLASQQVFLVFEPEGARLVSGFVRTPKGTQQWLGLASQFALGLGEPEEWQPLRGALSDPLDIPGAFADAGLLWPDWNGSIEPGLLRFSAPDGSGVKTFRIVDNSKLVVQVEASTPQKTQIPLVMMTTPMQTGWAGTITAEWQTNPLVTLSGDFAARTTLSSLDSLSWISQPEDPNRPNPPGHFLPMPLWVIQINSPGSYTIQFQFKTLQN